MQTLHIANKTYSSWSLRPWALLTQLEIPFKEELHPFPAANTINTYLEYSPSGRLPCLEDGKLKIWDSLAICEYLNEKYSKVWSTDPVARTWSRSVAAEMHSSFFTLRQQCSMHLGLRLKLKAITPTLQNDIDRIIQIWEQGLDKFGGPFLAGEDFTAVDAFFIPVAFRFNLYCLPVASTKVKNYIKLLLDLPCSQKWLEAARLEIWRDPEHDKEILEFAEILHDFRRI